MTTEEEEIDILGDFDVLSAKQEREISNISSGQILSCDYTVHPRWLDNADSTDIWIDTHAGNDCRQIFNSTELENCDEVTANENKLIFEKDIPALNEEEVITNSSEKDIICDLIEYNDELKIYCKPNSRSMQNNQVIISKMNKFEGSQMFAKNIPHRNKSKNNPISNRSNTKTGRLLKKLLKSNRIRKESKVKSPYVQKLSRNKNTHRKLRENNITITHEMDNNILSKFERSPLPPALISFGEIVKVINDVDSDLEVDIEDASEAISIPAPSITFENHNPTFNSNTVKVKAKPLRKTFKRNDADLLEKLKSDNVKIYEKLITMDVPEQELVIQNTEILEVEQFVHAEFFEGRPTKTRERYLKIRNHILNSWNKSKPNYLSKTAVRLGLKNCGDVHCISRIHSLLEQIGAINFNKSAYFQYIRPLTILIDSFNNQLRNKPAAIDSIERRPRVRLNSMNIPGKDSNTNITIEHVNGVAVPIAHVTIASNHETHEKVVQNEFELVKCLQFSQDNSTPIKITISISTLLCLYLHALSSNQEVMGFLGGHHERCTNGVNIQLTRYKPCRTSSQSRTMCEMCPVSQVEQTSKLLSEGYKLLGWVHTHPSFLPNPSRTDVKSQVEMQMQFSCNDIPFIAFILSCLDMSFKCFYVQAKDLNSSIENGLPYELNVEIEKDYSELRTELNDVVDMIDKTNPKNVSQIFNKFCDRSTSLFEQYSIDFNIAELIQSFELLK